MMKDVIAIISSFAVTDQPHVVGRNRETQMFFKPATISVLVSVRYAICTIYSPLYEKKKLECAASAIRFERKILRALF